MALVDAGRLSDRLTVLCLDREEDEETGEVTYRWLPMDRRWGRVELGTGRNLFSQVGIGARDAAITLRDYPLALHNALAHRGRHFFLTSLDRPGDGFLHVHAALVRVTEWQATRHKARLDKSGGNRQVQDPLPAIRFPAVITELYLGNTPPQELDHARTESRFALVTPPEVILAPGDLVTAPPHAGGVAGVYVVEVCHCLDEHKREYQIYRKEDV